MCKRFLALAVIFLLLPTLPAGIAHANPGVAFVRVTEGTATTSPLTLNIESSGTDRVLVVGLAYKSNAVLAPTSIVFNGTENFVLEKTAADGGDAQCFLYYLTGPTVTTADVVITMPSDVRMVGYVALFTGVDQTNPFTAATAEAQGIDAAPTVDVSSAADEICVDILAQVSAGPGTAAGAHTEICDGAAIGGGTDTRGAGQYVVGQATRTMNYTMSDADNWNIIAGALQEPSVGPVVPTVTTQAATDVEATTAIGNGNITNTGGENCDIRGIVWDLATHGDPGNTAPGDSDYANDVAETNGFGTGAFTRSLTGLPTGDTIYARAYAHNSAGYAYGDEVNFLTKPAAPTSVAATDGDHTDKVTITWTKSTGATDYQIYRDGNALGWLGDVDTGDDTGADAPTITPGTASATDGDYIAYVTLSLAGESADNGATHTYKVRAKNATGESADSATDGGYRGVGALTYQWMRSAADSDADYSNIDGATTDPYNDTSAPADGSGRYFKCTESATGAASANSTADRGYRDTLSAPTVTTSAATGVGATTATLNGNITDTGGQNASSRGFEWGAPSGNYTDNWTEAGSFGTGSFSHGISSLSENTTYYFRAMAYNDQGWGYGSELDFTTTLAGEEQEEPPPTPDWLSLIEISDTEIGAEWENVGENISYLLLVSTVDYPSDPAGDEATAYSGNATSANLTGYSLDLNTYYFSLWSYENPYSGDYAMAEIGGEQMEDLAVAMQQFATAVQQLILLIPLVFLSLLAFWRYNALLFMLAAGASVMTGLYWRDTFSTNLGMATAIILVAYAFVCLGFALQCLFWRGKTSEE